MTRGPATTLAGHSRPLSSVCWSRNGRKLLTSSHDRLLLLWDVETGRLQHRTEFESPVACACLHPTDKYVALACTTSSRPVVVDYRQADEAAEATPAGARTELGSADGASGDGSATAAVFSKDGAQIYVGDAKGNITVFDTATRGVLRSLTVGSGSLIRSISFNRSGQHFLTNSNDRTIRLFDSSSNECVREFRDVVNQMRWKKVCFSCDGDHILGGSQEDAKHNLYIWSTDGQLRKILEGPKEGVVDLAWHPMRPIIASCSTSGCIFIWATNHTENWSAFAPDFKELEENEEYEEREDEFDVVVEVKLRCAVSPPYVLPAFVLTRACLPGRRPAARAAAAAGGGRGGRHPHHRPRRGVQLRRRRRRAVLPAHRAHPRRRRRAGRRSARRRTTAAVGARRRGAADAGGRRAAQGAKEGRQGAQAEEEGVGGLILHAVGEGVRGE